MTAQEKMHAYLDENGIYLKDFAAQCGVAYTTLVNIHRRNDGVWCCQLNTITAVCKQLKISVNDFVDGNLTLEQAQRRFAEGNYPSASKDLTANEIELLARFRLLDKRSQIKEIGRLEALTNMDE
jgi:DNA-binding Xre family transcriptional regulator